MKTVKKGDRDYSIPYVPAPDDLPRIPYPVIKQTVHKNYCVSHYCDIYPKWPRKDVLLP